MKNILIVDSSNQTVGLLSRALNAYSDLFTVNNAKDGQTAIDTISNKKIDLVMTELNLPKVNGIALIKHLLNSHTKIPIIVMTAYGTPEIESKLNSIPSIKYFNKPLRLDTVIETIFDRLKIPFGQVDGVGFSSFLQLLEMEAKTCTLCIISKNNEIGTLYFLDGALIAAESEKNKNEDDMKLMKNKHEAHEANEAYEANYVKKKIFKVIEKHPENNALTLENLYPEIIKQMIKLGEIFENPAGTYKIMK